MKWRHDAGLRLFQYSSGSKRMQEHRILHDFAKVYIELASKRLRKATTRICFYNSLDDNVEPGYTYESSRKYSEDCECGLKSTPPPGSNSITIMIAIVKPEHSSDPVCEPGGEESSSQTDEIIKDRYSHSENKSRGVEY